MNFVTLETPRMILKGLTPEDMNYIFTQLPKEEIMALLGHRSEAEYLKEEHKQKNGYATYNRSFLLFLLTDKESGMIIGRCGIHNWNKEHNRAEIGYVMDDENYKRKGLMGEAVKAIMDYGFNVLNLHRVEAIVGAGNAPSLKLMEKNRFKQEGVLRDHFWVGDQYEDSLMFSILREEY